MSYQMYVVWIACFKIYMPSETIIRAMCVINFSTKTHKDIECLKNRSNILYMTV